MNADSFFHKEKYGVQDFINRWTPFEYIRWMDNKWVFSRKPILYGLIETSIIKMCLK